MALKRKSFKQSIENVHLGISSRGGLSTKAVKVSQIGWDGKELDPDAVGEQTFIMESTGGNKLKIRAAYHQNSPLCGYLENVLSDETLDRTMPAPYASKGKFDEIPPEIMKTAKGNRVVDWLYKKEVNGKVVSEVKQVEGKWKKIDYAVPLYKEYYNSSYEPISDEIKDGSDERGNYVLVFSKFNYIATVAVGFFVGHEIDATGQMVKGSEGVYMVEGGIGEKHFNKLTPQKSSAKVSIGNRIGKVFAHPIHGVIKKEHVTENGKLIVGKFNYVPKAVHVAIYNEDGEVAAILSDRDAYKVEAFKPKGVRKENEADDTVFETEATEELKEEVAGDAIENLI